MVNHSWTEFFKKNLEKLEDSFKKQGPMELSLLGFALKNNYVSSKEYINWAQEAYSLPILKPSFFQTHTSSYAEWSKWKNLYKWRLEIQPLADWDGHLIVGCLEIPMNFPLELKPIFLLCEFNNLESIWKLKHQPSLNTADNPEFILLDDSEVTVNTNPDLLAEVDLEIPEGLADATTALTVDLALNNKNQKPKDDLTKTQSIEVLRNPSSNTNTNYILNVLFDQHSTDFRAKTNVLFEKLRSYFEKSMILGLDPEEKNLRPHIWDNHFVPSTTTNHTIPLDSASIFKIVSVSQKPFHGHVVVNSINEKFFDDWNQGTIPAHVTIVPLIINNRIAGMIISLGGKSSATFGVLKFMENAVQEYSLQLSTLIDSQAA
ncbi:MAG: hypothetical protein AABY64_09450 [Bdellovibrionota bacterium]